MKKSKKVIKKKTQIDVLLEKHNQGIRLDIGCGKNKQKGFVGMDFRPDEEVDIVQDLTKFPWSLPDESVSLATASHVLEHINPASPDPKLIGLIDLLLKKKMITIQEAKSYIGEHKNFGTFIRFMDEVWRILKTDGQFGFVVPYAGSAGYWQDPTHINPITEATIAYFDPLDQSKLWYIYRPKPWKTINNNWNTNGNLEVLLTKRKIDKSYESEN